MEEAEVFSWSRYNSYRREVRKSYPSVYRLKTRKRLLDIVCEELPNGGKVLDVGSSDGSLGEKLRARIPSLTYRSMDIDRTQRHDYYRLEDINEIFDMVVLSEVIEHLSFEEGMAMLKKLSQFLAQEGILIVSTPNLHHPNRYWDIDHKTPYRYDDIGAALFFAGYGVRSMFRIYNDQFVKRIFRLFVASHVHRYLDIDFAKSIVAVAHKK